MEEAKTAVDLVPVIEQSSKPLTLETAGKIADALGLPKRTVKCVFTLDWGNNEFTINSASYVTDEQGKLVLDAVRYCEPSPPEGAK